MTKVYSKINSNDIGEENLEYINQFANYKRGTPTGITLSELDPEFALDKKHAYFMCIFSKRNTGKTVFLKHFLYQTRHWYDSCYVFSMTSETQKEAYDFCPKVNIHQTLDLELIERLYEQQKKKVMQLVEEGVDKLDIPVMLIVIDDMISDTRIKTAKIIKTLAVSGRHHRIGCIIISQSLREGSVPITVRGNSDIVGAFNLDSYDDKKLYCDQFLSKVNKSVGLQLFTETVSVPYQMCLVANCSNSPKYEDCVFKFIASLDIPDFVIGDVLEVGKMGPNPMKKSYDPNSSVKKTLIGPNPGPVNGGTKNVAYITSNTIGPKPGLKKPGPNLFNFKAPLLKAK